MKVSNETVTQREFSVEFLSGGGEMGSLIRNKDWTKSPLGTPDTWPQSLRTSVSLILRSAYPMFIWWGKDLTMFHNDAYLPVLGKKHPQALGNSAREMWSEIWSDIHEMVENVFYGRNFFAQDLQLFLNRKGFLEETYWTFSYSPILDEKGGVGGLFCACNEETDKIIGQRRLKTLSEVALATKDVLSANQVYKKTLSALQANSADIPFAAIYSPKEDGSYKRLFAVGGQVDTILPDHLTPESPHIWSLGKRFAEKKPFLPVLEKGRHVAVVIPLQWDAQSPPDFLVSGTNTSLDLDDRYQNYLRLISESIVKSVADVKIREEERMRADALAEIDRAKTIFFSNISHEFRTPLTLMLGPLRDSLVQEDLLPETVAENLKVCYRNSLRLHKLVNTLLDFSRIEAGRLQGTFSPVDIGAITEDIANTFRSAFEREGIALVIRREEITEPVYVDAEMWEKIVMNLISNAFKHTEKGSVTVSVSKKDKAIEVSVADTGIGIPEKELDKIFNRFYRVGQSGGRSVEGSGIGLSMVKELVKIHHGTIRVSSVPGHGSVFTVQLPVGSEHLPADRVDKGKVLKDGESPERFAYESDTLYQEPNSQSPADQEKEKILVVDDNADMLDYVRRILSLHYHVETARDGEEAYLKVLEVQPALVLSDVMMPRLDGFGLVKKIRENSVTRNMPVIFLSARAGEESVVDGMDAGVNEYLVKPFSARELIAKVDAQIKISTLRKATEKQLRTLFRQAPAAIAVLHGPDHVYTLANPLYLKLITRTEDQLINRPIREVFPEVEGQGLFDLFNHVYTTGVPFVAKEYPVTFHELNELKTGFYSFVIHPIIDDDKQITDLMVHAYEVTEQVHLRKKIEESEGYFRMMADSSPTALWVTKPDGYCTYLNREWYSMTGQTPEEALGFGWLKATHPEDAERAGKIFLDANSKQIPFSILYRLRHKNGEYRWAIDSGRPRFDERGEFQGYLGSVVDVHEQQLAEEKVRESETRYRYIFENTPVSIWEEDFSAARKMVLDLREEIGPDPDSYFRANPDVLQNLLKEVIIIDVNAATLALVEAASKEEIKRGLQQIFIEESTDVFIGEFKTILSGGGRFEYECVLQTLRGKRFEALVHIDFPTHEEYSRVLVTLVDISERKKAEEILRNSKAQLEYLVRERTQELERSNYDLQQFAHVASHDMKEPLRKIQIFSHRLREKIDPLLTDDSRAYLGKIQSAAQRMNAMIDGVLNYSSINGFKSAPEKVDLNQVVVNIESDLELVLAQKSARISKSMLPSIKGAPVLMYQLFYNLINNSLKFTRPGVAPEIKIKSRQFREKGEEWVEISVMDNGIGFEPEFATAIFDAFTRLNSKDQYEGTGLGLSLCKKIVHLHHGSITADGKKNEGSTFTLRLPLKQP